MGKSSNKISGEDSYKTVTTTPRRPTRTETGTTTIRQDDATLDTDLVVVDERTDGGMERVSTDGTVLYVTDRTGKETTGVAVSGDFTSSDGKYLGTQFLEKKEPTP